MIFALSSITRYSVSGLKRVAFLTSPINFRTFSISTSSSSEIIRKEDQKRIDVAIVGAPNAGKSQLLNCITKSDIAAVSRKRHTTRNEILGVRTVSDTQLVFVDTPGYLRLQTAKEENLLRNLIVTANTEIDNADYTLLVIDAAKKLDAGMKEGLVALMLRALHMTRTGKFGVALNKVDLVTPKKRLLNIAEEVGMLAISCIDYDKQEDPVIDGIQISKMKDLTSKLNEKEKRSLTIEEFYPEIFYTSALHDDGVDDIIEHLIRIAPNGEWIYEKHETTQLSPIERVEEIIREKIYRSVHKEVPHSVRQVNRVFDIYKRKKSTRNLKSDQGGDENLERLVRIDQDLLVKTESHRRILKGRNGIILERIQQQAKKDLEKLFKCNVSLNLHVKKSNSRHDRNLTLDPVEIEMV